MALFTLPGNEKQHTPSHIILDTRTVVRELRECMLSFYEGENASARLINSFWLEDMDKILPEILQVIAFKNEAEMSLQYESMQIVQESMTERDVEHIVEYTRFLVMLGMHLVRVLQRIGAYQNNRLMYAYKCMQNENIVLEHILFESPHDPVINVPA